MNYYIPVTGVSTSPNNGSWSGYWATMPHFESYDCFEFSSADFHNPLYNRFETVTGIDINQFEEQVREQQMTDVSMGIYQFSIIKRDNVTNQLYLSVPQSGRGIMFKLYESSVG